MGYRMRHMSRGVSISAPDIMAAHRAGRKLIIVSNAANTGSGTASRTVLVFSHRPQVRESIVNAVGGRPASDVGRVKFHEVGTVAEVLAAMDAGSVDLAILDGEAQPTGGMGLSRQLKNEITDCPPIVVAVQRRDDRWLATWSQADAVLVHPLDPLLAAETVADVLRRAALPAVRH
jgi:DNA-binding NtrC family response regulator